MDAVFSHYSSLEKYSKLKSQNGGKMLFCNRVGFCLSGAKAKMLSLTAVGSLALMSGCGSPSTSSVDPEVVANSTNPDAVEARQTMAAELMASFDPEKQNQINRRIETLRSQLAERLSRVTQGNYQAQQLPDFIESMTKSLETFDRQLKRTPEIIDYVNQKKAKAAELNDEYSRKQAEKVASIDLHSLAEQLLSREVYQQALNDAYKADPALADVTKAWQSLPQPRMTLRSYVADRANQPCLGKTSGQTTKPPKANVLGTAFGLNESQVGEGLCSIHKGPIQIVSRINNVDGTEVGYCLNCDKPKGQTSDPSGPVKLFVSYLPNGKSWQVSMGAKSNGQSMPLDSMLKGFISAYGKPSVVVQYSRKITFGWVFLDGSNALPTEMWHWSGKIGDGTTIFRGLGPVNKDSRKALTAKNPRASYCADRAFQNFFDNVELHRLFDYSEMEQGLAQSHAALARGDHKAVREGEPRSYDKNFDAAGKVEKCGQVIRAEFVTAVTPDTPPNRNPSVVDPNTPFYSFNITGRDVNGLEAFKQLSQAPTQAPQAQPQSATTSKQPYDF